MIWFHSFSGEHADVTLSRPCTGDVLINKEPVCAVYVPKDKELIFDQLCNNLGCGNSIQHWRRSIVNKTSGWYFSCIGHETFLWQCHSWKGQCDHITSVACQSKCTAIYIYSKVSKYITIYINI